MGGCIFDYLKDIDNAMDRISETVESMTTCADEAEEYARELVKVLKARREEQVV